MSIQVSELRPEDYEEVAELLSEHAPSALSMEEMMGMTTGQCPFNSVLSLVAREDHKIIAAILCKRDPVQGYVQHLAVVEPHRNDAFVKLLMDKALLKLNARGVHKCRVMLNAASQPQPFWEMVSWSVPHSPPPNAPSDEPRAREHEPATVTDDNMDNASQDQTDPGTTNEQNSSAQNHDAPNPSHDSKTPTTPQPAVATS